VDSRDSEEGTLDSLSEISFLLSVVSVLLGFVSLVGLWLGSRQGKLIAEIAALTDTLRSTQVAAADLEILEKLGVLRQHAVNLKAGDMRRVEQAVGDVRAVLSLLEYARDDVRDDLVEAIACVLEALAGSDDERARQHAVELQSDLSRRADAFANDGKLYEAECVRSMSEASANTRAAIQLAPENE
jgi:hypothetical protein